ncbi:MAG: ABC transporter permease [Paludibacteraceae bacterium]|nr:ABC transporter permease [Paludibacteraceae bacterium]
MNNFKKVLVRELSKMFERPIYIFSSVIVMLVMCVFFFSMMDHGVPQRLPMAVVDHDQSYISRRFVKELNSTSPVQVTMVCSTYAEAREAMQKGEIYSFIELPENMYADILSYRRPKIAFYVNYAYLTASTQAFKQLFTMANLASGAVQQELLKARCIPEDKIMDLIQPIVVETHQIGNPWSNYSVYMLSTLLPGILGLVILMLTIFSIGFELKAKTSHEWLETAGNNFIVAITAKMLPYTILYITLGLGLNVIMFTFLDFPNAGSLWMVSLNMILYVLAMQSLGITIIGCFPTLRLAISAGALIGMMGFSLSGFTYPAMAMKSWVQAIGYLFPLRHYYLLYSDITLFDSPTSTMIVPIICLMAWCGVCLLTFPRLHNAMINQNYPLK